jgi:Histidine kinase-, DNA gyrase B-, and HSP90-like ATPase
VSISSGAPAPDFQISTLLPRPPATSKIADFETERPDWALFGSLDTLGQKAGVPAARLRRLALKELVDNALDAGADVEIEELDDGSYVIEDNGPGIGGGPQAVANLFTINRNLVSSKQWRRPQRGALGNGLRVVAGSLIASGGGRLVVTTSGNRLEIEPLANGGANVTATPSDLTTGTKIEIAFGPYMPKDDEATEWAYLALEMADLGWPEYSGKSSPHWYDAQSFYDLVSGLIDQSQKATAAAIQIADK